MLASLAEVGQLLPVVVSAEAADRYVLLDGYKRVRALQRLSMDGVQATVWSLGEIEALLLDRLMRSADPDGALEQGWLSHPRWHGGGCLLDWAFASARRAPAGPRSAAQVREAVEAVLREVPAGPIESAIRAVLSESRLAGAEVGAWLRRQAARVGPDTEPAGSDDEPPALSEIAARLRHAVEGVEEDHFAELRLRLTERLAPR